MRCRRISGVRPTLRGCCHNASSLSLCRARHGDSALCDTSFKFSMRAASARNDRPRQEPICNDRILPAGRSGNRLWATPGRCALGNHISVSGTTATGRTTKSWESAISMRRRCRLFETLKRRCRAQEPSLKDVVRTRGCSSRTLRTGKRLGGRMENSSRTFGRRRPWWKSAS